MRHVIEAARETARQIEAGINPAHLMDAEAKTQLAASWLTFAELVERNVREANLAAINDELARPLGT